MRSILLPLMLAAACAPRTTTVPAAAVEGALAADTGRVAVEGGTLFYEARGSGPPVVLLHAGGMDHSMWDPQVEHLARAFRVVRYDARGHGRSTAPRGRYSTVEDLRLLLDHLGVQRIHLVGISMGAGVAFGFARAHPERVSRLVLVSTSAPPPGAPRPPPGSTLMDEAGRARLRALPMPRMLIVGEGDSADHLAVADAVEAEAPEVTVVRMEGGRHLVNRDVPEAFNEMLLRFLREQAAASPLPLSPPDESLTIS